MIKGVNHRIVEITGMNSDYFEKAVLYVRPEKTGTSPELIDLEARAEVGKFIPREDSRKKDMCALTVRLVAAAGIMRAAAVIFYIFFG